MTTTIQSPLPQPSAATQRPLGSGWTGFGTLSWYAFWKMITNPFTMGFAIALPIFMYLMFGAGQEYSDQWVINGNVAAKVLVNMAVYGTIMTSSSMGTVIALERTSGVSRLYALTPVSPLSMIAARTLATLVVSAVVIAITYAAGLLTGARMYTTTWLVSFVVIIAMSILPVVLGLACAFAVRSDGAFALNSAITVLGSFASGLFIPLEQMGTFWKTIAPYTPFHGLANIAQLPLYGWETFEWSWLLNYVVWSVVLAGIAAWAQSRDTTR
ncbi:ABC transporter permease [Schaalia sp. 19OD2882]|uniref:ABC transporter permease n=1 Tax=Schaalia sp. 19OD2882 TaxID=2794089 RepID=UPI001C1F01AA|nr:ABC transporter permease [Schaalia sp. 19OD2882]QWW19701.1 ABC transporter permease [Schaalia sp. 19OD2882]